MFLFQAIPWHSWLAWGLLLAGLMLLNEATRLGKLAGLAFFVALPLALSVFVWPKTSGAGSGAQTANWFAWVKTYSALVGCYIGLLLRFSKKAQARKWCYVLPAAILVLNIVTICGWTGIFIGKDEKKDMLWPDMLWFWVVAYDLWNFAYVYNCVPDHAFYAGAALLISCTIPAFFIKKGAWLQHRAQTLAFWMMFVMVFPGFVDTSRFAVKSSHSVAALWVVSSLALASNVAVFVYQAWKVLKLRKNPLRDELHTDLPEYQAVAAHR